MGATEGYDHFDRESVEVSSEFKHLTDKIYGEHLNINIGKNIKENFEGTYFQRKYDPDGNLELFRIFHQAHRAKLQVSSVDLPKLFDKIKEVVSERKKGKNIIDCSLPFDADTFAYDKIATFNEVCAPHLSLNVLNLQKRDSANEEKPVIIIEFSEDHNTVAEKIIKILTQKEIKIEYVLTKDRATIYEKNNFKSLDFVVRTDIDKYHPTKYRLDNSPELVKTYLFVIKSIFSFPFKDVLKEYILH